MNVERSSWSLTCPASTNDRIVPLAIFFCAEFGLWQSYICWGLIQTNGEQSWVLELGAENLNIKRGGVVLCCG
jgi:hypothetical protein